MAPLVPMGPYFLFAVGTVQHSPISSWILTVILYLLEHTPRSICNKSRLWYTAESSDLRYVLQYESKYDKVN